MESWILRVSCKVNVKPFGLHLLCKRPELFMIPWTIQKSNSFLKWKLSLLYNILWFSFFSCFFLSDSQRTNIGLKKDEWLSTMVDVFRVIIKLSASKTWQLPVLSNIFILMGFIAYRIDKQMYSYRIWLIASCTNVQYKFEFTPI